MWLMSMRNVTIACPQKSPNLDKHIGWHDWPDNVGVKTFTITGAGASAQCTVLLGVNLTGEKRTSFIIFKGMLNGSLAQEFSQVDSNVVCTVQKNAWMDEPTFLYWTESIWDQFSLSNQPACLLMDSCAVHETAAIKEARGNHGTKVLYIPRGLTTRLQVLDIGVKKPFKHCMRLLCYQVDKKIERLHIIRWWLDTGRELQRKP